MLLEFTRLCGVRGQAFETTLALRLVRLHRHVHYDLRTGASAFGVTDDQTPGTWQTYRVATPSQQTHEFGRSQVLAGLPLLGGPLGVVIIFLAKSGLKAQDHVREVDSF